MVSLDTRIALCESLVPLLPAQSILRPVAVLAVRSRVTSGPSGHGPGPRRTRQAALRLLSSLVSSPRSRASRCALADPAPSNPTTTLTRVCQTSTGRHPSARLQVTIRCLRLASLSALPLGPATAVLLLHSAIDRARPFWHELLGVGHHSAR